MRPIGRGCLWAASGLPLGYLWAASVLGQRIWMAHWNRCGICYPVPCWSVPLPNAAAGHFTVKFDNTGYHEAVGTDAIEAIVTIFYTTL